MSWPYIDSAVEESELLERHTERTPVRSYDKGTSQPPALGIPRSSRRIWKSDLVLTSACLLCFALSLVVVFQPTVAIWLGQVSQLIALGILVQLMSICTQRHLQYFFLVIECLWNTSSLQNFESIVQIDFLASKMSGMLRVAILLYLVLPLVLGVAYKNFTGGTTIAAEVSSTGRYGWTGPPGTTALGTRGIAMFYNATVPWWANPAYAGSYGFNLNVESFDRTAMLDGPLEERVRSLQGMLKDGETMTLSSTVNATVCDMVFDMANKTAKSDIVPWFNVWSRPGIDFLMAALDPVNALSDYSVRLKTIHYQTTVSRDNDLVFSMLVPPNEYGWIWNSSVIVTSRFNKTRNDTFGTCAQGFHVYRQKYNATWFITASSVALRSANAVPGAILESMTHHPSIDNGFMTLEYNFAQAFIDLDWKWMGDFGNDPDDQRLQQQYVSTDATLVAAMVWARLTAYSSVSNPRFNWTDEERRQYRVYSIPDTYQKTSITLQRSVWLALILAVNPTILFITLIIRVLFLHDAPISKDFGFATLLAGIDKSSLDLVEGAGYSGKLKRDVRLSFNVSTEDRMDMEHDQSTSTARRKGNIRMRLEDPRERREFGSVTSDRVKPCVLYS